MKKLLSAVTLSALVASSASAAVSSDLIDTGDIILGFYAAAEDKGLVVNLGAFQNFDNFGGATFNTRLDVADIASVYGANWNTRTDLFWTVTGATAASVDTLEGLTRNTIFSSQIRTNLGVVAAAPTASPSATQATNDANAIRSISGGYNTVNTTQVGGFAVVQNSTTTTTTDFRGFQITTPTAMFGTATDNIAAATTISDFYAIVPSSGGANPSGLAIDGDGIVFARGANHLGFFTLDASGLSFTASGVSAVPEPSTYAALAGAAVLGLAVSRRRSAVRA